MRHIYTAELARLRWAVIHARTGALVGAFANCADACLMRDNGPRNGQGDRLLVVVDCPPKVTKPRLRQRRRVEPRQRLPLSEMIEPEAFLDLVFQRSA